MGERSDAEIRESIRNGRCFSYSSAQILHIVLEIQERGATRMNIRKATEHDIDSIAMIYEAIHDEEEKGLAVIGWIRNVYPTRKTA